MRFHYIWQTFDAGENATQLRQVFDLDNQVQISNTAIDV